MNQYVVEKWDEESGKALGERGTSHDSTNIQGSFGPL